MAEAFLYTLVVRWVDAFAVSVLVEGFKCGSELIEPGIQLLDRTRGGWVTHKTLLQCLGLGDSNLGSSQVLSSFVQEAPKLWFIRVARVSRWRVGTWRNVVAHDGANIAGVLQNLVRDILRWVHTEISPNDSDEERHPRSEEHESRHPSCEESHNVDRCVCQAVASITREDCNANRDDECDESRHSESNVRADVAPFQALVDPVFGVIDLF